MLEEQDGFDEDQEYTPDPTALRVSARVIQRRADLLEQDAEVAADLLEYATDYSNLAARLEGRQEMAPLFEAPGEPAAPETRFWETGDFIGFERSAPLKAIGMELRRFWLVAKDASAREQARPAAVVELIGRRKGSWEILHAEVERGSRRKGVATMLYDRIEEFLATELSPSGWLSGDAYAFWRSRRPEAVAGHRRMEPFLQLWISPLQLLNLLTIDRSKIESLMESAGEDGAGDEGEKAPRRLN